MKVISIVNNKGGVAKTTTSINIASILSNYFNKKVLLVDFDPQSSATIYIGIDPLNLSKTSYDVLLDKCTIKESILAISNKLHLLPSSIVLSAGEVELVAKIGREYLLKNKLKEIKSFYDYIVIDNMPSLGILTINSLIASDYYIAPTEASYLSMKGLEILFSTISEIGNLNKNLFFLGVLVTLFDMRTKHQNEVLEVLKEKYKVFNPVIKKSTKFPDSCLSFQSIVEYAGEKFDGSNAYIEVVKEILKNG